MYCILFSFILMYTIFYVKVLVCEICSFETSLLSLLLCLKMYNFLVDLSFKLVNLELSLHSM